VQRVAQAFEMGGYGGYVWTAFGFTLIVMAGLLWQSWRAQRRSTSELAELRSTIRRSGRPRAATPRQRLVATRPAADGEAAPDAIAAQRSTSGS